MVLDYELFLGTISIGYTWYKFLFKPRENIIYNHRCRLRTTGMGLLRKMNCVEFQRDKTARTRHDTRNCVQSASSSRHCFDRDETIERT